MHTDQWFICLASDHELGCAFRGWLEVNSLWSMGIWWRTESVSSLHANLKIYSSLDFFMKSASFIVRVLQSIPTISPGLAHSPHLQTRDSSVKLEVSLLHECTNKISTRKRHFSIISIHWGQELCVQSGYSYITDQENTAVKRVFGSLALVSKFHQQAY